MEDSAELFCELCENAMKVYGLSVLPANAGINAKMKEKLCREVVICIDLLSRIEKECVGLEKLANSFLEYLNNECQKRS